MARWRIATCASSRSFSNEARRLLPGRAGFFHECGGIMPFDRDSMRKVLSVLADKGVYLGTSSWKYPGWRGTLYDDSRYVWRGRFSAARFERLCLGEYAQAFKTVCVDAA